MLQYNFFPFLKPQNAKCLSLLLFDTNYTITPRSRRLNSYLLNYLLNTVLITSSFELDNDDDGGDASVNLTIGSISPSSIS